MSVLLGLVPNVRVVFRTAYNIKPDEYMNYRSNHVILKAIKDHLRLIYKKKKTFSNHTIISDEDKASAQLFSA